jgi:DnaJ-class molecular chaperone
MAQTAQCPTCKGSGRVPSMQGTIKINGSALAQDEETTCPTCNGVGKIPIRDVRKHRKKDEFGPGPSTNGTEGKT